MEVGREVDLRTTALALLGGDDDDTVGRAATIYSGGGSVFEDGH